MSEGKVVFDISMSLDGFVTASNRRPEEPMGDGGQRLHEWAIGGEGDRNRELLEDAIAGEGATIAGRKTYDSSVAWWGRMGRLVPPGGRCSWSRTRRRRRCPMEGCTRS